MFPVRIFLWFVLGFCSVSAHAQHLSTGSKLLFKYIDKDSSFQPVGFKPQTDFNSDSLLQNYIQELPVVYASLGYIAASVDSVHSDSTGHTAFIYLGQFYRLSNLHPGNVDVPALEQAGYFKKKWKDQTLNMAEVYLLRKRLLDYYENNGYPFATLILDSIQLKNNSFSATLNVTKYLQYPIDSIRIIGRGKINSNFLQHYLGIKNGSLYNAERLKAVDKKIMELNYFKMLQPSDLVMTGTGAVLNLYVDPQKNSKVNFIVGFLPDPSRDGKLQLTGDVDLDLRNMMRSGESIFFKWQQLQKNSPRINLGFNLPYIFKSSFGTEFMFDMYKKDSSFLQLKAQVGLQYAFSANRAGKFVLQFQGNNILAGGVDTNLVKSSKQLPNIIDMSAVNTGLQFEWFNTDYRYNPSRGFEWEATALIGVKRVKPNQDILSLDDPTFDYKTLYDSVKLKNYQLNLQFKGAKYFQLKKNVVLKAGVNSGYYYSPQIYRNDQFRIGGYRTLRGFDEEGIFTDKYAIGTAELRYLSGLNSYLFLFSDIAYAGNTVTSRNNTFVSLGLGILLETKLGILNVAYAAGKRNDVPFNIREASKLHLGYINYF